MSKKFLVSVVFMFLCFKVLLVIVTIIGSNKKQNCKLEFKFQSLFAI